MHFNPIPFVLVASSTLAAALALPSAELESRTTSTEKILKALAGTYSLVNTSSTLNNVPIPDAVYGTAPVGQLIYTASGWMSATLTATEPEFRPNVTFPFLEGQTDEQWATIGRHSIGYAGPLKLNTLLPFSKTAGQVFHGPLTVANVPTMIGQEQKRNYTVIETKEGKKKVTYLKIGSERGGGFRGELWWKKLD